MTPSTFALHPQKKITQYILDTWSNEDGLPQNTVNTVIRTRDGYLWVGTEEGAARFDGLRFEVFDKQKVEQLLNNNILTIYQDRRGDLWFGTHGGGLTHLEHGDPGKGKFTTYTKKQGLANDRVRCLLEDRQGNLWIGTDNGLSRMKDGKLTTYTKKNGLSANRILCLAEDSLGTLWLGTYGGGPNSFKDGIFTSYVSGTDLSENVVLSFHQDRDGNLWFGMDSGLSRRDTKTGTFALHTAGNGLPGSVILCVYEDGDGILWIGTERGLSRLKEGRFAAIGFKDGLFDDKIMWILEDDSGNFWMSCNKGIFRANKAELNTFCDGKIESVQCVSYGKQDGMRIGECNGGTQPAGWKTRDGALWFPTPKGAVKIDPDNIRVNREPPPMEIVGFTVDDNAVPFRLNAGEETLALSPGSERLEFHYTGLSLLAPDRVAFRCKLEGYDKDWIDVGTRRTAYYTRISPGDYTFRVKACNNDGVWNETGASLSFYKKPYFYQTLWFYAVGILALTGIGFTGYRVRVRRLESRAERLRILVEEQTKDLKEAKEAAEEASRAKTEFLTNMSHEIRTPLNIILGFAETLEPDLTDKIHKEALNAISSSGKTLLGLINDILDLSRIEAGKMELHYAPVNPRIILNEITRVFANNVKEKGLDFQVESDPALPAFLLLDGLRLRQILFNLVGNAVKFTDNGFIKLSVHSDRGPASDTLSVADGDIRYNVVFTVRDSGAGIPAIAHQNIFEPFKQRGPRSGKYGGTGLGLGITRRLTGMMGGEISIESEEGKGSTFRIVFRNIEGANKSTDIAAPRREKVPVPTGKPAKKPGILSKLPELLVHLRGDMTVRWEQVKKTFILDELEDFAAGAEELSEEYRSEILSYWAERLSRDLHAYDMAALTKTLDGFPSVIEELAAFTRSKKP